MIPDGSHEQMEPPECNADDPQPMCDCCDRDAMENNSLCVDCQREADEMNGIYDNGTEGTVKIALPKFKTTDGRGTCAINPTCDHLCCPLIRSSADGIAICGWTNYELATETGYLRPCKNCPIHKP